MRIFLFVLTACAVMGIDATPLAALTANSLRTESLYYGGREMSGWDDAPEEKQDAVINRMMQRVHEMPPPPGLPQNSSYQFDFEKWNASDRPRSSAPAKSPAAHERPGIPIGKIPFEPPGRR